MSIFSTATYASFGLLFAAVLPHCGGDSCLRNSDCDNGHVCQVGVCVVYVPPVDGDVTADTATDATDATSEVEAGTETDGNVDSEVDASSD